jgi:hypothetical protein
MICTIYLMVPKRCPKIKCIFQILNEHTDLRPFQEIFKGVPFHIFPLAIPTCSAIKAFIRHIELSSEKMEGI